MEHSQELLDRRLGGQRLEHDVDVGMVPMIKAAQKLVEERGLKLRLLASRGVVEGFSASVIDRVFERLARFVHGAGAAAGGWTLQVRRLQAS